MPARKAFWWVLVLSEIGCLGPLRRAPELPRPPVSMNSQALVRLLPSAYPSLSDDSSLPDLADSVRKSADYYLGLPADRLFQFGPDAYTAVEMAASLECFLALIESGRGDRSEMLKRDFIVYASTGADKAGTVVFSSYYEHSLRASLTKTPRFCFPLYARPRDLEESTSLNGERLVFRQSGSTRLPYFSREEIDGSGALRGRGLEIAWADDPVEIFFLQVQGSGWLLLPNGSRLRVRYAGNNGLPYKSVGGHMIEHGLLTREKFSRKAMVEFLASHSDERQGILNKNPRYVFFQIDRGPTRDKAYGSLNLPLTPGRSVAMDPRVFPPGALAWMETFGKKPVRRFVLNQDEGGAIKGPARVDFFAGAGAEAETFAVGFWEKGRLFFLVKKRGGTEEGGR